MWTVNCEIPDVQAGFIKGKVTRDQIANICWIIKKAIEFQKNIYFCFIDYAKAFDCVDHNKLWKILQEMGIPGHLTCLLRNLYAGQEETVRTGHGTTDWFQIGKEYVKAVYSHPAYLTYMQSTLFQQHTRRLYTWTSPDGQHRNQIDYILWSQRWRSSIQSTKTRPWADCGSDHELLTAKFRPKLKKVGKNH